MKKAFFKRLKLVDSYNNKITSKCYWKFKYQKLNKGFTEADLYNLDYTLTKYILPRLIAFKESAIEYSIPTKIDVMFKKGYKLNRYGAITDKRVRNAQWKKAQEYWATQIQYMIDAFNMIVTQVEDDDYYEKLEKSTAYFNTKLNKIKDPIEKRKILKNIKVPFGKAENKEVVLDFEYEAYVIKRGLEAFSIHFRNLWW